MITILFIIYFIAGICTLLIDLLDYLKAEPEIDKDDKEKIIIISIIIIIGGIFSLIYLTCEKIYETLKLERKGIQFRILFRKKEDRDSSMEYNKAIRILNGKKA